MNIFVNSNTFPITTALVWCHGCNIIQNMPTVSLHIMKILTERDLSWPWSTRTCIGAMFESLRIQLLQLFCSRNWTPLSLFLSQAMWSGVLPNLSTALISKNVRNRHLIKISYNWFIYNLQFYILAFFWSLFACSFISEEWICLKSLKLFISSLYMNPFQLSYVRPYHLPVGKWIPWC